MDYYWFIVFFLFGITLGSFYNVVGLRTPKNISFTNDRSFCPHCGHPLQWYELIPLLSYLLQLGKCRHCKETISTIYPMMELFTGILFAYSFWHFGFTLELITAIIFVSMLVIVFVSDITYMIIPDKVLLFFLPFLIICRMLSPLTPWYDAIVGAIVGFVLIAVIIIASKGGMGAGDMKLFFLLGIVLGWQLVLLTFFLAALFGSIIGYALRFIGKIKRKQPIPFGPYIVIASLIAYFYGHDLIGLYLSLLF